MALPFRFMAKASVVSGALCASACYQSSQLQDVIPDAPSGALFSNEKMAAIGDFYTAQVEKGVVPGAAFLIYQGDELVLQGLTGYADLEARMPLTADTLYRIYSLTKPVLTAATLQLVERGKLALEQPISSVLPDFANMQVAVIEDDEITGSKAAQSQITVRHLLTHTAGFAAAWNGDALGKLYAQNYIYETVPYTLDVEGRAKLPRDLNEFGARLSVLPLAHEPGAQMTYGVASDVMGLVIEKVTGQTLDVYLRENIFGPLGMDDTSFCVQPDDLGHLANLYAYDPGAALYLADAAATSVRTCPVGVLSGGSGLVSTPMDYLKFAKAIHKEGGAILSPASAAMFRAPQAFVDERKLGWWMGGTEWGLSVAQVVDPSKTEWKDVPGNYYWSGGSSTYFWIDPRNDMIAIMFTQVERNGQPNTLKSNFRNLVYDAFEGAQYPGQ